MGERKTGATILIVDDDTRTLEVLTDVLRQESYKVITAGEGRSGLQMVKKHKPDVVLLDMKLPGASGLHILKELKTREETFRIPVIMITGQEDGDLKRKALAAGADEFVNKPAEIAELKARVRALTTVKAYYDSMRDYQRKLEKEVEARTREIKETMEELRRANEMIKEAAFETTHRLARAAEFKDEDTGTHIRRVSLYAAALAQELGESQELVEQLRSAAAMHDVGKIGIPETILLKPGKLDPGEWEIMKRHTLFGAKILDGSDYPLVSMAATIARSHHEKWDGSGYPDGLAGEAIPRVARIAAVADVFDALTSTRPYKDPFDMAAAVTILNEERERHFDPEVLDAFLGIMPQVCAIKDEHPEISMSISKQLQQELWGSG
ncbi:MAG: HD domain-containing phosphohydrolase [Spirochaetaceae bacterium]